MVVCLVGFLGWLYYWNASFSALELEGLGSEEAEAEVEAEEKGWHEEEVEEEEEVNDAPKAEAEEEERARPAEEVVEDEDEDEEAEELEAEEADEEEEVEEKAEVEAVEEDSPRNVEGHVERLWKTPSSSDQRDRDERRKTLYGGKKMKFHPKLLKSKKVAVATISLTSKDAKTTLANLKRLCSKLDDQGSEWALLIVQQEPWRVEEGPKPVSVQASDFGGSCVYLSAQEQASLPYRSVAPLPDGSKKQCSGRNVGYLYAIHHGAQVIGDIDETQSHLDDSLPLPKKIRAREMMDFNPFLDPPENRPAVVNPYRFFGLSSLRPRGFPLERNDTADYTWQPWSFGKKHSPIPDGVEVTIPIQQGLYLKHPDATISSSEREFKDRSYFARPLPWQPPIAIDKGSFTPLLGRNSFFHHEAFWGLFTNSIPTDSVQG